MSKGTVEIPIEVWEHCQQDAERMAYLHKECSRLQAENERLRKAGDRLHDALVITHPYGAELHPSIFGWDKAKEGRDAK